MNLEGFLTNTDVNTIKLTKDNIFLEYDDPNVGDNKPLHIDPRYPNSFFGLTGTNSENYTISRESLQNDVKMVGTILPRPVNIEFYTVIKEYDGSPIFDRKYLRYRFCKTGDSASGLITGTSSEVNYLSVIDTQLNKPPLRLVDNVSELKAVYTLDGYTETYASQGMENNSNESLSEPTVAIKWDSQSEAFVGECNMGSQHWNLTSFPVYHEGPIFTTTVTEPAVPSDVTCFDGKLLDEKKYTIPLPYSLKFLHGNNAENVRQPGWEMTVEECLATDTVYKEDEASSISGANTQPQGKRFTQSDVGCVLVDVDEAIMPSKNVTLAPAPLAFTNIRLTPGVYDRDASGNYIIQTATGYGQIYKRVTDVIIKGSSKVYDGTTNLAYELDAITRLVDGDDVRLDASVVVAKFKNKDAGSAPEVVAEPKYNLVGQDCLNYEVRNTSIKNATEIHVTPREITATVNELRVYRTSGKFEINYELQNSISADDIYLDFSEATLTCGDTVIDKDVFTGFNHINPDVIEWLINSNKVYLKDSENAVEDCVEATISGFVLKGKDSKNYLLTTSQFINIPIRIIQIH